jgi:hypothetical protein
MRILRIFGIVIALGALFFMVYASVNQGNAAEQEFISLINRIWFPAFVIGLLIIIGANAGLKAQEKQLLQGKKKEEKK